MQDAARILNALVEKGETEAIKNVFSSMPQKWRNKIKKSAKELDNEKLSAVFGEERPKAKTADK
jgi:tRNA/tmRNA/rRNA uracil-C5-methylase (TrmA/RlmC/RlmD family)